MFVCALLARVFNINVLALIWIEKCMLYDAIQKYNFFKDQKKLAYTNKILGQSNNKQLNKMS